MSKAVSFLMVCTMVVPNVASAQSQEPEYEVAQAVKALTQAMIEADGPALHRLTADALSYGHSSGNVESKAEFVKTLVSGESVFEDIQLTDQTVEVVGNTAIVRHVLSARTNDRGKEPGTVKLSILLVWVKDRGQWQLLARQAVKIP
ncbi:nuclear transport factor 2 family protein [Parapedobacter deserti]|uniref:Nuclear transport factor 2 family protein n=1 Tax=Parapedobacter deserti TaxID=1912957 RepID=A0ABV7JIB8_9SPHI